MPYIENPKTKGSGIVCAIPQTGECPNNCADCFFQSGRSYLEPLADNLPNMPPRELARNRVVRVNDGNDSNFERELVIRATDQYTRRFFNTAFPELGFPSPVVFTVNPGPMTDRNAYFLPAGDPPRNLMFVRVRVNTWNLPLVKKVVDYYTDRDVPVVLTFMAYFTEAIPEADRECYVWRKRTLNSYWAITTEVWRRIMADYEDNVRVHSCGKVEGERGNTRCKYCGNCLREYYATLERMR